MTTKNRFLNELCSTCESISATLDYDEALYFLVKNVAKCLKAKGACVGILRKDGAMLDITATYGLSGACFKKTPVEVKRNPIVNSALTGEIIRIKDITKDKRFQYPQEAKKEGIKSLLCLRLKCQEKILGILQVYTGKEHLFSDDEITFINTLASQGAAVIKNAMEYERLKTLNNIGKTITSQLDIARILDIICQTATCDIAAKGASIMLINRETAQLEVISTYGLSPEFIQKGPIKIDKSIGNCLNGELVVIENTAEDKRVQYPLSIKKEGINSIICIPLKLKDKIIGTLRIYTGYRYKRNNEDMEFLSILADFGTIAIENARLYEHVKKEYDDLKKDVWKWYEWGQRQPKI